MNPKRVLWIAGSAAFLYVGVFYWAITNFELPPISGAALVLIIAGGISQIVAKGFFGLLFRESIQRAGREISIWTAFKAALVGAGVARLIPAGGAVTPVAMAWMVREESEGSAGAAIRTVLLNYAGLMIMTGVGLLLARPRESAQFFSVSLFVLAPFILGAGLVLMFGSGKLGTLLRLIPARIRARLEASMVNHTPAFQSQLFIWGRLVAEAAALWLVLEAFGIEVNAYQVMAAFGVSQLAGGVPGTPGGIGITEGALAFILAAYGLPVSITLAPVLVFRVISYWLPAGLGFMAGGSRFLGSEAARAADAAD